MLAYVNHKCVSMDDAALATHAKARAGFLDAWDGVDVLTLGGSSDSLAEACRYAELLELATVQKLLLLAENPDSGECARRRLPQFASAPRRRRDPSQARRSST